VLTYSRRQRRLSGRQTEIWDKHAAEWWIPDAAADIVAFDPADWFGRVAPLVVEIGSGIGETASALAENRPEANVLAFEVWRPGIAETFVRLEQRGLANVRLISVDAVWSIEHLLAPETISELWTFFPDPWPKTRHLRRRLVNSHFAHVASTRLRQGALWRLATDAPGYATQMEEVLSAEPLLRNVYDGPAPRWSDRPVTRFERRGLRAGRPITDLVFWRV